MHMYIYNILVYSILFLFHFYLILFYSILSICPFDGITVPKYPRK